ncbi:MAG: NUDIX domain-containing protein [Candidatus Woesearchaeota archaeon]
MPKEVSAGAVVFKLERGRPLYLLLHYKYKTEYWDFSKGNVEAGEAPEQTALREVKEETGLSIELIEGFKEKISWFYRRKGEKIFKEVTYFLGKAKDLKVKISEEAIGYVWLPFEEAVERLTFKNSKEILYKANAWLENALTKKLI